jgi:hypothetical protein
MQETASRSNRVITGSGKFIYLNLYIPFPFLFALDIQRYFLPIPFIPIFALALPFNTSFFPPVLCILFLMVGTSRDLAPAVCCPHARQHSSHGCIALRSKPPKSLYYPSSHSPVFISLFYFGSSFTSSHAEVSTDEVWIGSGIYWILSTELVTNLY